MFNFGGMMRDMFGGQVPPFAQALFPTQEKPQAKKQGEPSTRFEKACTAFNSLSKTVAKIDDDGIDVYCFPGAEAEVDRSMGVKNAEAIAKVIAKKSPGGEPNMTAALCAAMDDAFETGFDKPCAILVITAGLPADRDAVKDAIQERATRLENAEQMSITFVQVGDSKKAERFLGMLDDKLECTSSGGDKLDMVDTIKDEDIKKAMAEMQGGGGGFMDGGGKGGLAGAFMGMAMGAGAYYMYNKYQAKKRTEGWNGKWEIFRGGESTGAVLEVADNGEGQLTIEGYPEDGSGGDPSPAGGYEDNDGDGTYTIFRQAGDGSYISGNIVDEHEIEWQDDTVWREVPPEGVNWTHMALAAAGGAAAGGAAGYLVQKKFFKKAENGEAANYKLVLDCSEEMLEED